MSSTMKVLWLLLAWQTLLIYAATTTTTVNARQTCRTLKNETGRCVPIAECQPIFKLVEDVDSNQTDRESLRKSQCGWDGTQKEAASQILVCCAQTTTSAANELPKPGVCGKALHDRILGGSATKLDEFPWMALLAYKKPHDQYGFHCGGSLINARYVLTAGHCVQNPAMPKSWSLARVRLGEWDTSTEPDCVPDGKQRQDCAPTHIDVPIEQAITHEHYVASSIDQFHDIALLRLQHSVAYSDFIKPICLPVSREVREEQLVGTAMDVAGWGATESTAASNVKLKIVVYGWQLDKCQAQYSSYEVQINSTQLCAGGEAGIDTCRGDSGGPLMVVQRVDEMDIYFVAGIVSYGPKPCGLKGWPGIYTRVGSFIDWIQSNLVA